MRRTPDVSSACGGRRHGEAYRHALEYRAVFWLVAETADSLMASFLRIADSLHLPDHQHKELLRLLVAAHRWLASDTEWLLIWDIVENWDLLQRFLPPALAGAHLLSTQRAALGPLALELDVPPVAPGLARCCLWSPGNGVQPATR